MRSPPERIRSPGMAGERRDIYRAVCTLLLFGVPRFPRGQRRDGVPRLVANSTIFKPRTPGRGRGSRLGGIRVGSAIGRQLRKPYNIKRLSERRAKKSCESRKHRVSRAAASRAAAEQRGARFSRTSASILAVTSLRVLSGFPFPPLAAVPAAPPGSSPLFLSRTHPRVPWHLPAVPLRETKMVTASALQRRFIPRSPL